MGGAAAEQLVQATIADLRAHAPFDRMEPEALRFLATRLKVSYFPKGAEIVGPEAGVVDCLFIVKRGAVRGDPPGAGASAGAGVAFALGEGECFPIAALVGGRATSYRYRAEDDSFFYEADAATFQSLLESSTRFHAFCTSYLGSLVERSQRELRAIAGESLAESRSMLESLANLVSRAPVSCTEQTPLSEVLKTMTDLGIGSMVVVDTLDAPVGIFTPPDVIRRVVLAGVALSEPVRSVMTREPFVLSADAPAFEAALGMMKRGIRHAILHRDGRFAGVVSERDMFAMQRVSLRHIAERIRGGRSVEALQHVAADTRSLVRALLAQGFGAEQITQAITTLNDSLCERLINIIMAKHRLPGRWCWIALGSEGRAEQTLATDQDNALILETASGQAHDRAKFLVFAEEMNEALDRCGFPLCKGEIMARNPDWCLTLDEWRTSFTGWIHNTDPQALLNAAIFFDFRALAGDSVLAGELRQWMLPEAAGYKAFLRAMAANALAVKPPIGLIRDFITDDSPEFPNTVDLKKLGTRPFVDAARIYALAHRIPDTGTAVRLRKAGEAGGIPETEVASAVEAFQFIQTLRVRHQYLDVDPKPGSENRISPVAMSALDRRILKESFRVAVKLQERLRLDYLV